MKFHSGPFLSVSVLVLVNVEIIDCPSKDNRWNPE